MIHVTIKSIVEEDTVLWEVFWQEVVKLILNSYLSIGKVTVWQSLCHVIILDVDWLRCSVHSISVARIEDQDTNVVIITSIGIPILNKLTVRNDLGRN